MFWRSKKSAAAENSQVPAAEPDARFTTLTAYTGQSFAQMSVAAFILDRGGRVVAWNDACASLTGLAAADVIGTRDHWKGFYLLERPCLADVVLRGGGSTGASLYAAQKGRDTKSGAQKAENWCDLPCGARRYLEIDAAPLLDERGDAIGVVETLVDLTRLKTMEEELALAGSETANAVARERDLVGRSIGAGLARLAARDLTFRLTEQLPDAYALLQDNFNAAAHELEQAMIEVVEGSHVIGGMSGEIADDANELAKRTEQQAATLEETAAAMEELTATVRHSAEGANRVAEIVGHTLGDAEQSGVVVGEAVSAMGSIEKSSRDIGGVVDLIEEIAFQTNLLSLNASIEAARAGDHGRGFAVVAAEVRALSLRSAEAAKEINVLVSSSSTHVAQGVELVGRAGDSLQRIVAQVQQVNKLVGDMASASREQATTLAEVGKAVASLDQTTQKNMAMVENTSVATQALSEKGGELLALVGAFAITQDHAAPDERKAPSRRRSEPPRRRLG